MSHGLYPLHISSIHLLLSVHMLRHWLSRCSPRDQCLISPNHLSLCCQSKIPTNRWDHIAPLLKTLLCFLFSLNPSPHIIAQQDLPSPISLACSLILSPCSVLFSPWLPYTCIEHVMHTPAPGPLHLLFPLHVLPFPEIPHDSFPYFLLIFIQMSSSQWGLFPWAHFLKYPPPMFLSPHIHLLSPLETLFFLFNTFHSLICHNLYFGLPW